MKTVISQKDVCGVVRSFLNINEGDEATEDLIFAIGAELLDISSDKMREMIGDREGVQRIKEQHPEGTRVRLNHMDDPQAVPDGTEGTVTGVDDIGQIMVKWDNGLSLPLVLDQDDFTVLSTPGRAEKAKASPNTVRRQSSLKGKDHAR